MIECLLNIFLPLVHRAHKFPHAVIFDVPWTLHFGDYFDLENLFDLCVGFCIGLCVGLDVGLGVGLYENCPFEALCNHPLANDQLAFP